jgi:uncharacterized protein YbaR (Trm112 family)/SAM-dependent methyltransferase
MNIKPSDVVLEIGSGNNPNPHSDILCDRYLHKNEERAGEFGIVIDRPFIVADGYHLPFADKTFDFVICSHILEHMDNPKKFISEITRVGKRGYIEVPSAISERIFGWDFHHWYCSLESNTLVLRKKSEGERFGGFFHRLIARTIWFRRFFEKYERKMYTRYEWNSKICLRVDIRNPSEEWVHALNTNAWQLLHKAKSNPILDSKFYCSWMFRRAKRKLQKTFRLIHWRIRCVFMGKKILTSLLTVLVCPYCHERLHSETGEVLYCEGCKRTYPIVQRTIPVLLTKSQIAEGY